MKISPFYFFGQRKNYTYTEKCKIITKISVTINCFFDKIITINIYGGILMHLKQVSRILLLVLLLTGCKFETMQEAIEDDLDYKLSDIIHVVDLEDDKKLVFFTFDVVEKNYYGILNVALVEGNNESGWELLGRRNPPLEVQRDMLTKDEQIIYKVKNKEDSVYVIYGNIINPDIATIEVGNEQTKYVEANIINYGINQRFFYHIYDEDDIYIVEKSVTKGAIGMKVRALLDDGRIVYEGFGY